MIDKNLSAEVAHDDASKQLDKLHRHQRRTKLHRNGRKKWVFEFNVEDTSLASATSKPKTQRT